MGWIHVGRHDEKLPERTLPLFLNRTCVYLYNINPHRFIYISRGRSDFGKSTHTVLPLVPVYVCLCLILILMVDDFRTLVCYSLVSYSVRQL